VPYKGEDRRLVPSQKVATYDLMPEMSARAGSLSVTTSCAPSIRGALAARPASSPTTRKKRGGHESGTAATLRGARRSSAVEGRWTAGTGPRDRRSAESRRGAQAARHRRPRQTAQHDDRPRDRRGRTPTRTRPTSCHIIAVPTTRTGDA
jgi:hypothetical protein